MYIVLTASPHRTTEQCTGEGKTSYECVAQRGMSDVQPIQLMYGIALCLIGLIFSCCCGKRNMSLLRVAALVVALISLYYWSQTIVFIKSCDQSRPPSPLHCALP